MTGFFIRIEDCLETKVLVYSASRINIRKDRLGFKITDLPWYPPWKQNKQDIDPVI